MYIIRISTKLRSSVHKRRLRDAMVEVRYLASGELAALLDPSEVEGHDTKWVTCSSWNGSRWCPIVS